MREGRGGKGKKFRIPICNRGRGRKGGGGKGPGKILSEGKGERGEKGSRQAPLVSGYRIFSCSKEGGGGGEKKRAGKGREKETLVFNASGRKGGEEVVLRPEIWGEGKKTKGRGEKKRGKKKKKRGVSIRWSLPGGGRKGVRE